MKMYEKWFLPLTTIPRAFNNYSGYYGLDKVVHRINDPTTPIFTIKNGPIGPTSHVARYDIVPDSSIGLVGSNMDRN